MIVPQINVPNILHGQSLFNAIIVWLVTNCNPLIYCRDVNSIYFMVKIKPWPLPYIIVQSKNTITIFGTMCTCWTMDNSTHSRSAQSLYIYWQRKKNINHDKQKFIWPYWYCNNTSSQHNMAYQIFPRNKLSFGNFYIFLFILVFQFHF